MLISADNETCFMTDTDKSPPLVCSSFAYRLSDNSIDSSILKWDDPRALDAWADSLQNPEVVLTQANIAFDACATMRQWPELTPLWFDAYENDRVRSTVVVQKLIDIAYGQLHRAPKPYKGLNYSLQAMVYRHFDHVLDKTLRENYGPLRDVPLADWNEAERQYPIDDAAWNLQLDEVQQTGWPDLLRDQYRQSRHEFWLYLVGAWGIRTDPARVARLKQQLEDEWETHRATLAAAGLIRQKKQKGVLEWVRDTKKAQARMAEVCPAPRFTAPSERFPQGQISLDDDACTDSGDPILEAYGLYSKVKKRLSTDIPLLLRGEIHARFDSLKETGRTGCSDPNLQNLPKAGNVRECFVPRPGFVFADADYDGLELRTMAQACLELLGESTMADVLNSGQDVHLALGADNLHITYDEAKQRLAAGDKSVKKSRQAAKPVNFGRPGGMGDDTFIATAKRDYGIVFTVQEAQEHKATWLNHWPEFRRYFALASAMCDEGPATIEQLFSGRFRGGLTYTEFCNTYFQGLGADAAKAAGWAIVRACYDWTIGSILYGSRMVLYEHDRFVLEVWDDEHAHDKAVEMARLMCTEANKWLPDVPATTTPALATCFSKDTAAVYDRPEGEPGRRLVPWSPEESEEKAA